MTTKLMPEEPTERFYDIAYSFGLNETAFHRLYSALIAAAPEQPDRSELVRRLRIPRFPSNIEEQEEVNAEREEAADVLESAATQDHANGAAGSVALAPAADFTVTGNVAVSGLRDFILEPIMCHTTESAAMQVRGNEAGMSHSAAFPEPAPAADTVWGRTPRMMAACHKGSEIAEGCMLELELAAAQAKLAEYTDERGVVRCRNMWKCLRNENKLISLRDLPQMLPEAEQSESPLCRRHCVVTAIDYNTLRRAYVDLRERIKELADIKPGQPSCQ